MVCLCVNFKKKTEVSNIDLSYKDRSRILHVARRLRVRVFVDSRKKNNSEFSIEGVAWYSESLSQQRGLRHLHTRNSNRPYPPGYLV